MRRGAGRDSSPWNESRDDASADGRGISLARLTLGALLAHHLHALDRELQAVPAPFRVRNDLLDVEEHLGIAHLLAQFLQEGMDLGEDEKHFTAERRLQEQVFIQHAQQDKRCSQVPIAADLAQPVVFLRAYAEGNLHELVRTLGKEFSSPPVAGLAHLRLAAQIIEFQNQVSIGSSWLLRHGYSSWGVE